MKNKKNRKRWKILVIVSFVFVALLTTIFVYATPDETDRIHFLNVGSSDAILIESNGHYGLVDTSNPSSAHSENGFSSTSNNGVTVVNYLNKLGVEHLDFIIGTHSHSDHIGGIPDIVDANKFIDSDTTYIYKKYTYISKEEGAGYYYNNQKFYDAATKAMSGKSANMLEVSAHESSKLNKLSAKFVNNTDDVLDYIEFTFNDYNIKVFNLYNVSTTNENANSLVTLVTKGSTKTLLMADMDQEKGTEQKLGKYIGKVNLYKVGHHGYNDTSYGVLDSVNPEIAIYSYSSSEKIRGLPLIFFKHLGTKLYRTGENKDSIIATINNGVTVKTYDGATPKEVSQTISLDNGPGHFYRAYGDTDTLEWIYVKSDYTLTFGWDYLSWENKKAWYYFDRRGILQYGWLNLSDGTYYTSEKSNDNYDRGAMVTGWQYLTKDGKGAWFYFARYNDVNAKGYKEGQMVTGWQEIKQTNYEDGTYYFKTENDGLDNYSIGAMVRSGWHVLPNKDDPKDKAGYYFEDSGLYKSMDNTAPTVKVTGNSSTPSLSVTLKITTAYDCQREGTDCIGLATAPFSFDGGISWQSGNVQTFYKNGPVNIWVKDKADNITKITENITSIDTAGPTITSVTGNRDTWSKENVTLTINVSDDSLHTLPYSFDDGESWQSSPSKTYTENKDNIKIKVRDSFGNITSYDKVVNITKIKRVTEISMKDEISKKDYIKSSETLDVFGGSILVKYNNGDTETVNLNLNMTSGFNNTTLGNKNITVKYVEPETGKTFTTKFTVRIIAKSVSRIEMNTYPTKKEYVKDSLEELNLNGGSIKVIYNDNQTEIIYLPSSDVSVSGFNNSKVGKSTITLTYENKEVTFDVNIIDKKIVNISVTKLPTKVNYILNYDKELVLDGGTLTIYYNDNSHNDINLNDNNIKTSGFVNTSLGKKEITVNYEGFSTKFDIEIVPKSIKSIKLTKNPKKMDYVENYEDLDLTGAELTVTYDDETKDIISLPNSLVTSTGFSNKNVGTSKVLIIYENHSVTLDVNIVPKSVKDIEMNTLPIKKVYIQNSNEELDLSGGVLKVNYNNNTSELIDLPNDDVVASNLDLSNTGSQKITLTYNSKTTFFNVSIIEPDIEIRSIAITTLPYKTKYIQNYDTKLNLAGGVLTVTYTNNTERQISLTSKDITYEDFDNKVIGVKSVKIKYNGFETLLPIEIVAKSISKIALTKNPNKMDYIANHDNLDLTGAILTVTYNDKSIDTINLPNNNVKVSGFSNSTVGQSTITLSYSGLSITFKVNIIPKSVTGITLESEPLRKTYIQGTEEEIDLYGGILKVNYSDGTSSKISLTNESVSVKGFDTSVIGEKEITVTYGGFEAKFKINIILKEIEKISIYKLPNKIKYLKDVEDLDLTGGELLITYNDESTDLISLLNKEVKVEGFDKSVEGIKKIIVKYQGLETSFDVEVIVKSLEKIVMDTLPLKLDYLENYEELDLTGGVIKAIYNDGEEDKISLTNERVTVSGFDNSKVGVNTLVVTYEDKETTFDVNIISKVATKIELIKPVTKLDYLLYAENLDLSGGIIKIYYNNNTSVEVNLPDDRFEVSGFDNSTLGEKTITIKYQGLEVTFNVRVYLDDKGDRGDNPKTGVVIRNSVILVSSLFLGTSIYLYLKKVKKLKKIIKL